MDFDGGNRGRLRGLLAALILLTGLAALSPTPTGAAPRQAPPLDLPAMALTPDDLAAEGLKGYGVDASELMTQEQIAAWSAANDGGSEAEALAWFEAIGMLRAYTLDLMLPTDPDRPDDSITSGVLVRIYEFEDAESAEEAFANYEDESADEGARDIEGTETIGDESELTLWLIDSASLKTEDGEIVGTRDPKAELDLAFRSGRIYAGVDVIDEARAGEELEEPEVAVVEALGRRMLARVEAGLAADTPGLANQVQRLMTDEAAPIVTRSDHYAALDGEALGLYGESEADLAVRQERLSDGVRDLYYLSQNVQLGDAYSPTDPSYEILLYRFEDEDAAADRLDRGLDLLAESLTGEELATIDEAETVGEASVTAAIRTSWEDADVEGYVVFLQVGDRVARVSAVSGEGIDLETVLDLAADQADCLAEGACAEPIPVPDGLLAG